MNRTNPNKIDVFLDQLSEANEMEYLSYTYTFNKLINEQNLDLISLFKLHYHIKEKENIRLIEIINWKENLFSTEEEHWIKSPLDSMDLKGKSPRDSLIELLAEELDEIEGVYEVDLSQLNRYFAINWLEILFQSNKGIYLLSFQFED